VDAGLVTDDYVDEKRLLTATMLRRLEVEEWDKERMKHFYYGGEPHIGQGRSVCLWIKVFLVSWQGAIVISRWWCSWCYVFFNVLASKAYLLLVRADPAVAVHTFPVSRLIWVRAMVL
jgi:hypothetical protein